MIELVAEVCVAALLGAFTVVGLLIVSQSPCALSARLSRAFLWHMTSAIFCRDREPIPRASYERLRFFVLAVAEAAGADVPTTPIASVCTRPSPGH